MAIAVQLAARQLVAVGCARPLASSQDFASTSARSFPCCSWRGREVPRTGTTGASSQRQSARWHRVVVCKASESEVVSKSRSMQLSATAVLTELLQAEDLEAAVEQNLDSINEEFFTIASTYVDMATKEGNKEVVAKLEAALKAAMDAKQKTLRPEIQLLNKLLAQKTSSQRIPIIQSNLEYLAPDSYFYQILNRFTLDVERQPDNPKKRDLVVQLKSIARETLEASKGIKKKEEKGEKSSSSSTDGRPKRGFGQ